MKDFLRKPGRLAALPVGARVLYSIYLAFAVVALVVASRLYAAGPTLRTEQVAVYYAGGTVADETPPSAAAPSGPAVDLPGSEPPAGASGPAIDLPGRDSERAGGPALDLPGLEALPGATRIAAPFNERRLLEVTHGHLFMMPVFFLIIAHLFVLVGLRPAVTIAFVGGGAASIALHIAGPWLVQSDPATWAFAMPVSGIGMLMSLGGMALVSVVAMWVPAHRPDRA